MLFPTSGGIVSTVRWHSQYLLLQVGEGFRAAPIPPILSTNHSNHLPTHRGTGPRQTDDALTTGKSN